MSPHCGVAQRLRAAANRFDRSQSGLTASPSQFSADLRDAAEIADRHRALLAAIEDVADAAEGWARGLRSNVRNGVTAGFSVSGQTELAEVLEVVVALAASETTFCPTCASSDRSDYGQLSGTPEGSLCADEWHPSNLAVAAALRLMGDRTCPTCDGKPKTSSTRIEGGSKSCRWCNRTLTFNFMERPSRPCQCAEAKIERCATCLGAGTVETDQ